MAAEQTTMRDEITNFAINLHKAGIPLAAIGDEFMVAGLGLLMQARGAEFAANKLERVAARLRDGEAGAHARKQ